MSDPLEINDDGNGDDIDCSHGNGVDNENDDWDNTIFILLHLLCSNPKMTYDSTSHFIFALVMIMAQRLTSTPDRLIVLESIKS